MSKTIQFKGQTLRIHLWDTAGQERFHTLFPAYLRTANVVLVCYDMSERTSFNQLGHHIAIMNKSIDESLKPIKCLVATKSDLESQRVVSEEEGQNFANEHGMSYHEVSSKTNSGVEQLFDYAINQLPFDIPEEGQKNHLNLDNGVIDNKDLVAAAGDGSGKLFCCF